MVGRTLSHYRVLTLLGRGGMGDVYAAEDLQLRRKIALKVLPAAMAADPERRRRFEREAQAVAALNHPGIVTIHSVEHDGSATFLTMELVDGRTVAEIATPGGMALDAFLRIAIPLADAVNAAHDGGILHRDLKPGNVMVTTEGRIKVLDFGLAKLAEGSAAAASIALPQGSNTTGDGQIVGTISYMAPEQAEGKPVDHRADIFALGVMLYELAAGIKPFAGETNVSILTSLLRDAPRPLSEIRSDLPPALGDILQRCMEKDPPARYESAAALRADLETLRAAVAGERKVFATRPGYVAAAAWIVLAGIIGWRVIVPASEARTQAVMPAPDVSSVLITGRHVAILDFEDRTGDASLHTFGRMASEAIALGLAANRLTVAGATEASAADGVTVAGAYSIEGDKLRFDGRLLSASRGTVVRVIDPIRTPRGDLQRAADETRRAIISAVLATIR
jgi:hypothetical protein